MPKPLRSVVAVRVAHHASVPRDAGRAHHAIYLRPDGLIARMIPERPTARMIPERPTARMIPERPIAGMIPERLIAVMISERPIAVMPEHSREQLQASR